MRIPILFASMLLIAVACKTSQKTADTKKNESAATTTATAAVAISPDLSAAADKRYPAVSKADIAEGEKLYNGKCGTCHGLPEVDSEREEKWPGIMDWMAPKARMDEAQKQKVLQYVLCAIDVKKQGK